MCDGGGWQTTSELDKAQQKEFSSFQRNFLVVQLVATFVDFIQGPYLYKVYESYGYSMVREHVRFTVPSSGCCCCLQAP